MGWFHNRKEAHEQAPWDGPFSPLPAGGPVSFNPMVKTAADLVGVKAEAPPAAPKTAAA